MLLNAYSNNIIPSVHKLWDAKKKTDTSEPFDLHPDINSPSLIYALYERIVILEQKTQEQDLQLKSLANKNFNADIDKAILEINEVLETKYCNGVHLWRIHEFNTKLCEMKKNPDIMYYSKGILTSPYGYGFCARINVSTKEPNWLALHVHMMKTENDSSLNWPFSGRINLTLVHPRYFTFNKFHTDTNIYSIRLDDHGLIYF